MRSRATNVLQATVLITGILYVIVGLFLIISPLAVLKLFAENISENWLELVRDHELVAPLYYMTKGFAAMLMTAGVAMVMPLFDPLRYRGLVYYNGLLFPLMVSGLFMKNGIYFIFMQRNPAAAEIGEVAITATNSAAGPSGHLIILILGVLFSVVFILNLTGVLVTRDEAKKGLE